MALRVDLTREAARDLDEIFAWTKARWSADQARKYLSTLRAAMLSPARNPRRHPKAPDHGAFDVEVRQFVCQSHRIPYTITRESVVILHVRHQARQSFD